MTKKVIRKKNKYFNIYDGGGILGQFADWNNSATGKFMKSGVGSSLGKLGISSGGLGGLANAGVSTLTSFMNPNGNSTGVGNALQSIGSLASNIPGVGGLIGAGVNMVGGVVNTLFGSNLNEEFIEQTESNIEANRNKQFNASSIDSVLSQQSDLQDLAFVSKDDVGSDGVFSNKASNKTKELNSQIRFTNDYNDQKILEALNTAKESQFLNELQNVTAYGGLLDIPNKFSKGGGIHIKKANRGKFTKYCGGKVTSECIAKGKRSSDPAVRKRATFAANARKWKHSDGGPLITHGGIFSNGITTINNGGTHEENPYEGIQMGIDSQGIPNLVEEGEVIYNDYVFSNRLKPTKDMKKKYKYKGDTFAKVAKNLQKESEERPNDPISKRGLEDSMLKLQQAQEEVRLNSQTGQEGIQYAHGGKMGILFDGFGDDPNLLDKPITTEELEAMMGESSGTGTSKNNRSSMSWLRYSPIVGSAIGLGYNILNKPDYSGPNAVLDAANDMVNYTPVGYTPIGNYLTYRPLDRNYYTNKLNAQASATRRALLNQSGANRATAMAGLLAADYNAQGRLSDLARQAEEYNLAQRERVEGFNRQTNMANSEMGLKASMANKEASLKAKNQRMAGLAQASAMRDAIDARRGAGISANLTNLFDSLGNVGREEFSKDMIENSPALLYNWSSKYKGKKSKGGYLTIKKKGR